MAYVSHGVLWLQDEGKSAIQLSQSTQIKQVSISDDGQIIAFTRQLDENHAELWTINVDGSNERRLISADQFTQLDGSKDALGVIPTRLQWEPGTHHLILNTYPIYHGLWVYEPTKPWLVAVDTGNISNAPYPGGYFAYSPDRKNVAIYDMLGLSLSRTDGSDLHEDILAPYKGIAFGEQFYDPQPYWAPDSSALLVSIPDQEDIFSTNATVTIWRVPLDSTPRALGQWKAYSPSIIFSPDQSYMAYWPSPEGPANQRELHLVQIDSKTGAHSINSVYVHGEMIDVLAWSPDSQHFIFQMGDPAKQSLFYYLGDICKAPQKIDGLTIVSKWEWDSNSNIAAWVDSNRYLLVASPNELRLGEINQAQPELLGEATDYDWAVLP